MKNYKTLITSIVAAVLFLMKGIGVQSCESDSRTCDFDSRLQQDDNGS